MKLHHNPDLFIALIEAAADKFHLSEEYIEKDYFVSLLLKNIVDLEPETIFKGGTSLSKCYRMIKRFSEDIDLNYKLEYKVTQGERRVLRKSIEAAITNAGLELVNPEEIGSKRMHNEYAIKYPRVTTSTGILKDKLLVEYYLFLKSFPCEKRLVNDYISDYLINEDEFAILSDYELGGFESYVQKVERTFMDKLFAICDYFEKGLTKQLSRHLYDIHMIWNSTDFDEKEFKGLFDLVSKERSHNKMNNSATDHYSTFRTGKPIAFRHGMKVRLDTEYH